VLLALDPLLGLAVDRHLAARRLRLPLFLAGRDSRRRAGPGLFAADARRHARRILVIGILAMALIGKHWQNLQRLLAGRETKIGARKQA
jgi:glycerol-3-phosphate acyltransferase PlsY